MQTRWAAAAAVAAMAIAVIIVIGIVRIARRKDAHASTRLPEVTVGVLALGVAVFFSVRTQDSGEQVGGLGDIRAAGDTCVDSSGSSIVLAKCDGSAGQSFTGVATGAPAQSKLRIKDQNRCLVALTENTVGTDECKSAQPWIFTSMNEQTEGRASWAIKYNTSSGIRCLTLPSGETRIIMEECAVPPSQQTQQWWIRAS